MLEHGGNLQQAAQRYGIPVTEWLDLSTGINPQHYPIPPLPPSLFQRLPAEADELLEAAAAYYGCQHVLATAGSQAALQVLPRLRAPCRVAIPRTMYQEHAHAWKTAGHTLTLLDTSPSDEVIAHCDVLVVCNPNNPTGHRYAPEQLLGWHQTLQQRGGWLVVDEAFMDCTPEHSIASHCEQPGLWVLRSLGKFFGLAGLRVGFLLGEPQALMQVQALLGPWTVTGPSQLIATLALQNRDWQQAMISQLQQTSLKLAQTLTRYALAPQGGSALFQYVTHPNSHALHQALAEQGIWTRYFPAPNAMRFGLPNEVDWPRLEAALKLSTLEK
ncbi:threonine-phosphate decarboxylase CobD [Methylophilus aquaticus]|uniref:threonine-phosphate decarboxylase n=1 Tax=Methylophilus aquaticus TaxID=1971610 RepID=A0ABT9JR29_9PROT|nr:threonine-phosphate decarboxylase CobD [Methylophilus aquaticus]MDP8567016.1 threonine-phosphate decarboxylase CobD [Methylophilus aquaticus]